VSEDTAHPRDTDEWRVEVELDEEQHWDTLWERLRTLNLDDEARRRLGHSVLITRDGRRLYAYAWHEQTAREAERTIRDLLEEKGIAGEVQLTRWHPLEDAWKPAVEPLPETSEERSEEFRRHAEAEAEEMARTGNHPWQVAIDLPDLGTTIDFARELEKRGLSVTRRWKYLLVGAPTEEAAVALGRELEADIPDGAHIGIRANPNLSTPGFVLLARLKPETMRDLGI
jgi:hypothetical protein